MSKPGHLDRRTLSALDEFADEMSLGCATCGQPPEFTEREGAEMTDQERIVLMLDSLHELQLQRECLKADQATAEASVLTPEIRAQLAAIECEYAPQLTAAGEKIAELEAAVKSAVVAHGETVKGAGLQAVWQKGRVSWDTKALDGYAAAHPEIERFRKTGEPSVSLRSVNGK